MTSFARTSLHTIGRILHLARTAPADAPGSPAVLDGLSAVVGVEARVCDGASLGAGLPASGATQAWKSVRHRRDARNIFDRPISEIDADGPRGAMAGAIGLSMSGERAATFLSGTDALAATDLFIHAAGQRLPLVVHLAMRAATSHAQAAGSGHEAYHALADTGCALLFAANVQEAVDLALIARRAAERALTPVVVVMDGEQTALSSQDLLVPSDALLRDHLGGPADLVEPSSDAQRMVFGSHRRRVPRRHDLESPELLTPHQGPESFALGGASRAAYFHDDVAGALDESADALAARTGRRLGPIIEESLEGAKIVLVVQGAATETAVAACRAARRDSGRKIGVLGLRRLRPLPAAHIARALRGVRTVAVLERTSPSLAGEGPLLREIRNVLSRAHEVDRAGRNEAIDRTVPPIPARDAPRLVNAFYGHGGLPLRAGDLLALCEEIEAPQRDRYFVGMSFTDDASQLPKRQAMLDALRRSFPEIASAGVRRDEPPADIRPPGATTIAIVHDAPHREHAIAGEVAVLLHNLAGGRVRARPALAWQRSDEPVVDIVTHAPADIPEAGDEPPIDIVASMVGLSQVFARLRQQIGADASIALVGDDSPAAGESGDAWASAEAIVGSIARLFMSRAGDADPKASRARAAREVMLADTPEPERTSRLDAFERGFESLELAPALAPALDGDEPPVDAQQPAEALAAFWNRVGVLYRKRDVSALTPDPLAAGGAIPALSATFRDAGAEGADRLLLPVFDPTTYDGAPDIWTGCPDGSAAPVVISPRALLDAGVEMAGAAGRSADALRAVSGKLARRVAAMLRERETVPPTAGEILGEAGGALIDEMSAPDDRTATLRDALDAVIEEVGALPVAATEAFFHEPERVKPGSGELLSVVVNPDSCKAPAFLASICEGRGVRLVERTPESLAQARRLWRVWRSLPDTPGETIERARQNPRLGTLAGVLLSRHCLLAMCGGSGAEIASGQELALRHALALAEFHLQPRFQQLLRETESRGRDLAAKIHETLGSALPDADLDTLAQGIDALGRTDLDLASISAQVDAAVSGGRVDGVRLGRLVDVARGLADCRWRLARGPTGDGRSRVGLTIGRSAIADWAGVYPWNPFRSPVALDGSGEAAHIAVGLLEGQLRQSIDAARLMRWADLELNHPERAPREAPALAALSYADLTPDERRSCPPMILVGDGRGLAGTGLSQLAWALSMPLPIKVLLLADMGGAADKVSIDMLSTSSCGQRTDITLLAMLTRSAYVAQTSIGDPAHFAESMLGALAFDGPALISVHAPSPGRHGFPADRLFEQARLAVQSRAVPLLRYDPGAEGVFGSRLDLTGNPDTESVFAASGDGRRITPVDWAAGERRFHAHLRPLAADDAAPTPIDEYLELTAPDRDGRTPFVQTGDDPAARLRVAPALVADADDRLRLWRMFQELAGVVTPFTASVKEAARQEVESAHKREIEALRREHEAKVAQLRSDQDAETTRRVTARLLSLAGYDSHNGGTGCAER